MGTEALGVLSNGQLVDKLISMVSAVARDHEELISDPTVHHIIENSIFGGLLAGRLMSDPFMRAVRGALISQGSALKTELLRRLNTKAEVAEPQLV